MKKFLFLILLSFFISCATDQTKFRETTKNNYLEMGSYSLGIDKKFEYIGSLDGEFKADNIDDATGSQIRTKRYVFADVGGGKQNIRRSIIVYEYQLKNPHHHFRNEISYENSKAKGKIESSYINLGNVRVAYMLLRSEQKIHQSIIKLLSDNGYQIDKDLQKLNYITAVYYGKLIGRTRSLMIVYIDGNEDCKSVFNESREYLTLDN